MLRCMVDQACAHQRLQQAHKGRFGQTCLAMQQVKRRDGLPVQALKQLDGAFNRSDRREGGHRDAGALSGVVADRNATAKQVAVTMYVVDPADRGPVFGLLQACQREGTGLS